jgi:ankyrin repeat protein
MLHKPELLKDQSPVAAAAAAGRLDIVERLVALGQDVDDNQPLRRAMEGDWDRKDAAAEIMEFLLKSGAQISKANDSCQLDGQDTSGCSDPLLCYAAWRGYVKAVGVLVKHGADVNQGGRPNTSMEKRTPLMCAAIYTGESKDRNEMIRLILEGGADPARRDSEGRTYLDIIKEYFGERDNPSEDPKGVPEKQPVKKDMPAPSATP